MNSLPSNHTHLTRSIFNRSSRAWPATIGHRFRIIAICWLVPSAIAVQSFAQPASPEPTELTLAEMQAHLASLRQELERERAALTAGQRRNAAEIERLRDQRKQLADRLLTAQIELEENKSTLDTLRAEAAKLAAAAEEAEAGAAALPRAFREAAEQATVHLNEVPAGQTWIDKLRETSSSAVWSEELSIQNQAANAAEFLSTLSEIHDQAVGISVRQASIFTADGSRQPAKLLSVGQCRFAYETADGRVGLALSSPREISGFRWSENLTPDQKTLIRDAIAAVESGTPGLVSIPLDPLGRIRPESLNQEVGLIDRVRTGGLVMYPLAGLALVALLLIGERFFVFYVLNKAATGRVRKVLKACEDADYGAAESLCNRGGAVFRVLAACLRRRPLGQRAMEDSIQEQLLHELPLLQRFMGGIATLAAVAPLLGLLGTVTGIIRTFGVIRAFGNANPSLMAGGISEALMTTASGLVIAVPILIVHSILRGRSDRIVADAERYAANMLTVLTHSPHESAHDDTNRRTKMDSGAAVSRDENTRSDQGNGHPRHIHEQVEREVGVD